MQSKTELFYGAINVSKHQPQSCVAVSPPDLTPRGLCVAAEVSAIQQRLPLT